MDMKRKITLGAATLAVALGAGHLVQNGKMGGNATEIADAPVATPTSITPLAATTQPDAAPPPAPMKAAVTPKIAAATKGPEAPTLPVVQPDVVLASVTPEQTPPPAALTTPVQPDEACRVTLDVMPGANGMLDLTLLSPCKPSTRVVLRHGGLAVTGRTSDGGALFSALPAMDSAGEVSVMFPDGTVVRNAAAVDLSGMRRFAVQWMADDRFSLNAFHDGAAFGSPGHVHAGATGQPDAATGWLMPLGDATVDLAMMAQVYTWPQQPGEVAIDLEAQVTEATCARELLGETIESDAGKVVRSDITLAMPDCTAVGDFLVLNNLLAGMTTAAAE